MAAQDSSQSVGLERPRTALALLCAASFLAVVDTTIVPFLACLSFVVPALILSSRGTPLQLTHQAEPMPRGR